MEDGGQYEGIIAKFCLSVLYLLTCLLKSLLSLLSFPSLGNARKWFNCLLPGLSKIYKNLPLQDALGRMETTQGRYLLGTPWSQRARVDDARRPEVKTWGPWGWVMLGAGKQHKTVLLHVSPSVPFWFILVFLLGVGLHARSPGGHWEVRTRMYGGCRTRAARGTQNEKASIHHFGAPYAKVLMDGDEMSSQLF